MLSIGEWGWLVLGALLWVWDHLVPKTAEAWIGIIIGVLVGVAWIDLEGRLDKMSERIAALDERVRDLAAAVRGKEDSKDGEDDD